MPYRFLYYEYGEVNNTTVFDTLYASEKYSIKDLTIICQSCMESIITEETVCDVMETAWIFSLTDLYSKCLTFINRTQSCAKKVFESSAFLNCSRDCLVSLVKTDELPLDEQTIYKSLIRWAENRCMIEGKNTTDSSEIRKVLGNLVFQIRFPLISLDSFSKDVDIILSEEEKRIISQLIDGKNIERSPFSHFKRIHKDHIFRELKHSTKCIWNQLGEIDAISFETNNPFDLDGLVLNGSLETPYTYSVEVKILSSNNTVLSNFQPKTVTESSTQFQIYFEKPCPINPNELCTIWVKMKGPPSFQGEYSNQIIHKGNVIRLYNSHLSSNATDVTHGQIPGFICFLKK
mgnify:CR=1 FL=1